MELDLIVIFPKDGNFAKFAALSPQWVDVVISVLINHLIVTVHFVSILSIVSVGGH